MVNYGLRERYEQLKKRGDRLDEIKRTIDWECLRPLLNGLFTNDTEQGGRPNYDEILMVKILFLQSIYNTIDESMETEIYDSIRFINFLNYPERVTYQSTIWLFMERFSRTGKDKALWKEVWNQFKKRSITVGNGTIQDVVFISSDPRPQKKEQAGYGQFSVNSANEGRGAERCY